jgi:hypothetical protein
MNGRRTWTAQRERAFELKLDSQFSVQVAKGGCFE